MYVLLIRELKDEKELTSEELTEVRSGGTSLEAGVTLVGLGLSLLNNFRMGTKSVKKREQGGVEGVRGGQ